MLVLFIEQRLIYVLSTLEVIHFSLTIDQTFEILTSINTGT